METYFPPSADGHQSQLARARVLNDIRALVSDGEVLLMVTADDLSRSAMNAREQLVAMLARAKAFVGEAQEHPMESARLVLAKAESTVKRHPLAALAAAFGTGLCLGALLSRQTRSGTWDQR